MNKYKYLVIHSDEYGISVYPTVERKEAIDRMHTHAITCANDTDMVEFDEGMLMANIKTNKGITSHQWRVIDIANIV